MSFLFIYCTGNSNVGSPESLMLLTSSDIYIYLEVATAVNGMRNTNSLTLEILENTITTKQIALEAEVLVSGAQIKLIVIKMLFTLQPDANSTNSQS